MLLQIWWTSVPIWSFALLSFVPFLAFAVIQRRKRDWADLVAARDKLGTFSTADELRDHAVLPPGRVDELRDLMIFS